MLPTGFIKVANLPCAGAHNFRVAIIAPSTTLDAMLRQYELVERVRAYDPDVDEALLNRAYVFTVQKHGSQTRASGDPYFSHPVEVAGILTDLHLDSETIVTAMIHDPLENPLPPTQDNERMFAAN